ncbi:single-stranded DNA-binding protein [Methylacidiphilum sp. Yel]|jgi:single-strand DNA-binding protein|uniref:single-stranded DNA-binding protein n=1 Tax=Methylacidiphilum sp. Yel TaxID=1847730 RepID=UPI00106AA427|nr:single-stranded DNA-binding protein [Methylacidiphilum sp. Yel]TFE70410.1 single-stranded DNA-binding protein [Methylacidiphilum sp. Yel]
MADLNKVFLIGNLTRDPECRYTPKGTPVGDISLAINSSYRAQDGQVKDEVCFVEVVIWGRQAETCKEYLQKGSLVFVEGRLQMEQWETKEGEKRTRMRVRADRIQFLGKTKGTGSNAAGPESSPSKAETTLSAPEEQQINEDEVPF